MTSATSTRLAAALGLLSLAAPAPAAPIDFNRQIRPLLAENCFACHGPDEKKRKADLRLDTKEGLTTHGSLVVPGKPDKSDLIARITSTDPDERMPPAKSGKKLTPEQIDLLKRWVAEGGAIAEHWAFVPPKRPPLPHVADTTWGRTPVDAFVLARLRAAGLTPSPEADKITLLRRLSLDLTGLPPTPAEIDAFLADATPSAYERQVDRLLKSPRYGEHLARFWLDAARYGDTHGLHLDNYREIWPYRDWVIEAFNENKRFDTFIVEQLAGDLLPNPTPKQIIATGYNRCHVTTAEGGSIEEEVYVRNVTDQVDTNGTVFLGLTLGCARCHDHKYDPLTAKDYYGVFAFFNSIDGRPLDGNAAAHAPVVRVGPPEQLKALDEVEKLLAKLRQLDKEAAGVLSAAAALRGGAKPTAAPPGPLAKEVAALEKDKADREKTLPTTLVYRERSEPRPSYLLKRGEYDQRGDKVERAVPGVLGALPPGAPVNRLGFARWLVDGRHPLTARVAVNRLWQQLFGTGLVKTTEDFGAQGEPPTHPELLDWLAVQFVADGWDVKATLKRLALSSAYRQSGKATPERLAKDPNNRLLSRGPRQRLDAEVLRDQALFVSGLLVEKQGGPSVKPPQPVGLWEAVGYTSSNTARFSPDTGREKVHRRSLYIFWKRTSPPPQMTTFDAPSREACTPRRERTNTPLQALLLMNEVQYVEAARALAERGLRAGGADAGGRIAYLFRMATGRRPDAAELGELTAAHRDYLATYRKDVAAARQLIHVGESKPDPALDPSELAALTMVGNVILNLDEVVTKG